MSSFVTPARLLDSALPERGDWVAALPVVVAGLAARWSLRLGEPFQPGGSASWVAPVRDRAGQDLVLKVGWRHTEALHEADALALWDGDGTVLVHAVHVFGETGALLLERCVPGTSLNTFAEPDQDVVVGGLLRRLWCEPPAGHPFRSLQVRCTEWADALDARLAATTVADSGLVRAGIELFRELPASADRNALLYTDLHAGNILASQREPWLAIDPEPYVGDPAFDVVRHILNCQDRLLADPLALARRLADLGQVDADRVALWLFARSVLQSLDNPALGQVARRLAPA